MNADKFPRYIFLVCGSILLSSQHCSCYNTALGRSSLSAVTQKTIAIFDGAEYAGIESFLVQESRLSLSDNGYYKYPAGAFRVVTGKDDRQRRIVGIESLPDDSSEDNVEIDEETFVSKDSIAEIPNGISDSEAISTLIASLGGVHVAAPRSPEFLVSGKAVVLGGGDFAQFSARGLAALGCDVTLVSSNSVKMKGGVTVMSPAMGELELGFASVLGEFDSVLDTIHDENKIGDFLNMEDSKEQFQIFEEVDVNTALGRGTGVVRELKKQHKCSRYVSTFTNSQRIVRDEGVFFGPKKAKLYESETQATVFKSLNKNKNKNSTPICQLTCPKDFGPTTLQTLLNEGIIFPPNKKKATSPTYIKSWSLKDFWEYASWPRDSSGGDNVRFGLPVIDDTIPFMEDRGDDDDESPPQDNDKKRFVSAKAPKKNPFVLEIEGIDGLNQHILAKDQTSSVLFLSAPWCRVCKTIYPQYSRMARIVTEDNAPISDTPTTASESSSVTFYKAEAMGKKGRDLGRALEVDSVPTFILFRNGKVYGEPLSIGKMPSKKLDLAVDYLVSGKAWDSSKFADEKSK